ncbi:MAG: hypothetical protein OXD54_18815 [Candidatus Poribacteria bacterium]|nr:hypothetical protein [Candidatus Poribacteria bacterium]
MKDRIVFFGLGVLISTLAVIAINVSNQSAHSREEISVFDSVIIKGQLLVEGQLSVGDGENQILLKNTNDGSNIILKSNDSSVSIVTNKQHSAIIITPNIEDFKNNGASLISGKRANGTTDTYFRLADDDGLKIIETDK